MAGGLSRDAEISIGKLRKAWVQDLPKALKAELQKEVVESAEQLASFQRRLVPVDQGDLRDSIVVTGPGGTTPSHSQPGGSYSVPELAAVVTAGNTKVRYAHLVEYGTKAQPAQSYFWPAYRLMRAQIKRRLGAAFRRAVKKIGGGGNG